MVCHAPGGLVVDLAIERREIRRRRDETVAPFGVGAKVARRG